MPLCVAAKIISGATNAAVPTSFVTIGVFASSSSTLRLILKQRGLATLEFLDRCFVLEYLCATPKSQICLKRCVDGCGWWVDGKKEREREKYSRAYLCSTSSINQHISGFQITMYNSKRVNKTERCCNFSEYTNSFLLSLILLKLSSFDLLAQVASFAPICLCLCVCV
jgi:hypothetical protein